MTTINFQEFFSKLDIGSRLEVTLREDYDISPDIKTNRINLSKRETPLETPYRIEAVFQGVSDRSTRHERIEVAKLRTGEYNLELKYDEIKSVKAI